MWLTSSWPPRTFWSSLTQASARYAGADIVVGLAKHLFRTAQTVIVEKATIHVNVSAFRVLNPILNVRQVVKERAERPLVRRSE